MKPGPPRRRRSDGVVLRDVPVGTTPYALRGTLDAQAASLFKDLLAEAAADRPPRRHAQAPARPVRQVRRTNDWGWRFLVLALFGASAVTWRWFAG